jgi:hypothetical protein
LIKKKKIEEWFINLLIHAYQYKILLRLFHHFSFHSCCSYCILVYFRFVSHFSLFHCVSHFSIFRFVSLRFVIFRFVSFRCVSISFRSLVQPTSTCMYILFLVALGVLIDWRVTSRWNIHVLFSSNCTYLCKIPIINLIPTYKLCLIAMRSMYATHTHHVFKNCLWGVLDLPYIIP